MNNKTLFLVSLVLFGLGTFAFTAYVYYNMKNERIEQEERDKQEALEVQKFLEENMVHGLQLPPPPIQNYPDIDDEIDNRRPAIGDNQISLDGRLMVIFNEEVFWLDEIKKRLRSTKKDANEKNDAGEKDEPDEGLLTPPQIPCPKIGEGGITLGGNVADSKDANKDDKPQTRPK